jgi:hypothetical protein
LAAGLKFIIPTFKNKPCGIFLFVAAYSIWPPPESRSYMFSRTVLQNIAFMLIFTRLVDHKLLSVVLLWLALQETCKINILSYTPLWRGCVRFPTLLYAASCCRFGVVGLKIVTNESLTSQSLHFACILLFISQVEQIPQYSLED